MIQALLWSPLLSFEVDFGLVAHFFFPFFLSCKLKPFGGARSNSFHIFDESIYQA